MDQFVGHGDAPARRPCTTCSSRWRRRGCATPRVELEAAEAAIIERDDLDDADALRDARSPTTPRPAATSTRRSGTTARSPRSASRSSARDSASSTTLSGGEQKRLALEALLRGPDEVLLLDEPDNYLDVPGKRWLETQLRATPEDRAAGLARPRAARARRRPHRHPRDRRAPAARPGCTAAASRPTTRRARTGWTASTSCAGAGTSSTPRSRRSSPTLKVKATASDEFASRYRAAQTRLAQVRGGRPARGAPARAGPRSCGCAARAPASAPSSPSGSSSPGS